MQVHTLEKRILNGMYFLMGGIGTVLAVAVTALIMIGTYKERVDNTSHAVDRIESQIHDIQRAGSSR